MDCGSRLRGGPLHLESAHSYGPPALKTLDLVSKCTTQRRELHFALTQRQSINTGLDEEPPDLIMAQLLDELTFDRKGLQERLSWKRFHSGNVVCRKKVTIVSSGGPNHSLKNAGKSSDR